MTLLSTLPWELAPDLPWRFFTPPAEKWATQPSFVVGEYLFIVLAALCLWHARRQADVGTSARARHTIAWFAALLAGTANDVIFMALPLVDNFWQAQATIMLTPRLPLYIPCVYVCFMYIPTVAAWRVGGISRVGRAAFTGLLGSLFYAPYDIVGAKFLWWTWHDSDKPIAARLLGAPMSSTLWVLTFVAAFAWLLGRGLEPVRAGGPVTVGRAAKALGLVAGLSTLLMMVQMTALQQLDGGSPGPIALSVGVALFAALALVSFLKRNKGLPGDGASVDRLLASGIALYFAVLALIMTNFVPETHQSASLHQTYGPCGVEQKDITGLTRFKYVCAEQMDEDYDFACVDGPPPSETQWYTVCGKAHTNQALWLGGVLGLGLVGAFAFVGLLRPPREEAE